MSVLDWYISFYDKLAVFVVSEKFSETLASVTCVFMMVYVIVLITLNSGPLLYVCLDV